MNIISFDSFTDAYNLFMLIYVSLLLTSYLFIGVFSSLELYKHHSRNKDFDSHKILSYRNLPTICVIAPAYNEELTIVENIRSLMALQYPKLNVIVVNDGSKDQTLQKAIDKYELQLTDYAFESTIKTTQVRGIYQSMDKAYSNLIVVDKANGGKADALNAGINVARSDLVLCIDVDCIIEPDGILKMVKPFLEEVDGKRVIATGGVIRIVNSCEIRDGIITKVNYPKNLWAKFQVLEYFRAFTMGRMAWNKVNGLLMISGAFGMFDRSIVTAVGGYDTTTVGEDFELVVRMRQYMYDEKKGPHRVAFIPDPLCWTEVPTSLKILSRQRRRWSRGCIDTLLKHRKLLHPRYGLVGMLSYPYFIFFEWLSPLIEFFGLIFTAVLFFLHLLNFRFLLILMVFVLGYSLALSSFAVFFESFYFQKYKGQRFLSSIIGVALLEMVLYHPISTWFSIRGNYEYFIKRQKNSWGTMTRTAFK
jgi:cellulose synthase/poly-beta-1,6-N-acetylglucosamine synthase-like glycosyltransferase